jgi:hypothetical protein
MIFLMLVLWFVCGLPEPWTISSKRTLIGRIITKTGEFTAHVWASYGKSGI